MLTTKDKVEQFKRELRSYTYYKESVKEINLKLCEINTKLLGISSITYNPVHLENAGKPYHDNKLELICDEERLINERSYYERKLTQIDDALNKLNLQDKELLIKLYIEHKKYDELAEEYSYSIRMLKYKVNRLIEEIM